MLRSTHNRIVELTKNMAEVELLAYKMRYRSLLESWNSLVGKVNAAGGVDALRRPKAVPFTKKDVQALLALCHPDKHGGKQLAHDMTVRLLELRDNLPEG